MATPADEVRQLERQVQTQPGELRLHHELAQAHRRLFESDRAEALLAAICDELPYAFTSMLHLARCIEVGGDRAGAVIAYTRAIKTAQLRGFWRDEQSTPPWLQRPVLMAMDVAARGRGELYETLLAPHVARHGSSELARVRKSLAMYLGVEKTAYADPRQRPTFLYVPDLPVEPVFARERMPFVEELEAQTSAIADELAGVLASGQGVRLFHDGVPAGRMSELTRGGAWDAYFFYRDGTRIDDHHQACPRVSEVLAALPLDHVRDHGPEVCFSILRPGAHILPHRGVTNARAVLHLGLDIPAGDCVLDLVGVVEQRWARGASFAFDDTFEHQAWNRTPETRAILLADIWNPHLRAPEREALADLVARIGDFRRATEVTPPEAT